MAEFIGLITTLVLLVLAYFVGTARERAHFANIRSREEASQSMTVMTFETLPAGWQAAEVQLVTGNVVISLDYFKRFIANLRTFFGGRIVVYEPLMDRARREAILRMKETAKKRGYDAVINVRLESSRIANSVGDDGTAGVEILAFGTALKFAAPIDSLTQDPISEFASDDTPVSEPFIG